MPRPKDLVKGWLGPVTYLLAVLATGQITGDSLLRALVVLAAVELLVYPARYQWNDVRGFVADQHHPASHQRGRLPGPIDKARARVAASGAAAVAKLLVTALLIVLLPGLNLFAPLAFAVSGIFGVAVVYEVLRSTSTGKSDAIPERVRPGVLALWLVVGGGYVVRGMLGVALAVDLTTRPAVAIAAAIALWCYGIAFVTSRWSIEALAFATVLDGRLTWKAGAGQAREHLLTLVRWLPPGTCGSKVDEWAPLRGRTPFGAPWNSAIIAAGAAAALTGRLLSGACPVRQGIIIALLGGVAANSLLAWGAGMLPGAPAPNPALGGALTPPGAIGAWGTPVSAGWAQAGTVGKLSVPPTWAANTVGQVTPLPPGLAGFDGLSAAASKGTTNGMLSGLPTSGLGRRAAGGYTNKYGFKYSVLTRSPSAG
ncbi:PE/PPE C-terminal domain-containing protein [Mycobacterium gordonae]|uniref:PE/PPE C-terminal domain-containing protein n=1 Tax=Mycobacterium gordonae TaxID=1778 RepID=UPI0018D3B113|nr:hypothetical protein [Mycobacterium gordonae]